jgi:hypothetical protein
MKNTLILVIVAITFSPSSLLGADLPETSRLQFVSEYIRELAAIESIREAADVEMKQGDDSQKIANGIYFSTRVRLELATHVKPASSLECKFATSPSGGV